MKLIKNFSKEVIRTAFIAILLVGINSVVAETPPTLNKKTTTAEGLQSETITEFSAGNIISADTLNNMKIHWDNIINKPDPKDMGAITFRSFYKKTNTSIAIQVSDTEQLTTLAGITTPITIVYAVGGQPREHKNLSSFSPKNNNKLIIHNNSYNLSCQGQSIGRENDSYFINASYCNNELIISSNNSSGIDSSQLGNYEKSSYMIIK
jgi:hypothetical protein